MQIVPTMLLDEDKPNTHVLIIVWHNGRPTNNPPIVENIANIDGKDFRDAIYHYIREGRVRCY